MTSSSKGKINGYKNDAGYTLDTPTQASEMSEETRTENDEEEKTPPWKKARNQINNYNGLSQHNLEMMVEGHRRRMEKTITRIENSGQEVPERLKEAYQALCQEG